MAIDYDRELLREPAEPPFCTRNEYVEARDAARWLDKMCRRPELADEVRDCLATASIHIEEWLADADSSGEIADPPEDDDFDDDEDEDDDL